MTIPADTIESTAVGEDEEEIPVTTAVMVPDSQNTSKTMPTLTISSQVVVSQHIIRNDDASTTPIAHQRVPTVEAVPLEEPSSTPSSEKQPTNQTVQKSTPTTQNGHNKQQKRKDCVDDCCFCCYYPQHPFCCDYNTQASCCHGCACCWGDRSDRIFCDSCSTADDSCCTGIHEGVSLLFMSGFALCGRIIEGFSDCCEGGCYEGGCCVGVSACCESGCTSGCECCCACLSAVPF